MFYFVQEHFQVLCIDFKVTICLSIHLPGCLSVCLSICQSLCLSFLSTCSSIHLSVCPSIHLLVCQTIHLSRCLSVCKIVNVKCNLFTHGSTKELKELIQKCPCIPGSNSNLEMLVFEGKPEYPDKNLSEQSREPTTNSTHI